MLLTPYLAWIKVGALALLLASASTCAYRAGGSKARAEQAEQSAAHERQVAHAIEAARATERRQAQAIAHIAEQHEKDKADAKRKTDRLVADLRAGVVRLREHWSGCTGVPGAVPTASELDACARDREASAARIVDAAAAADAQITGLQQVIVADRSQ